MDHLALYSLSQTHADLPADESWLTAGERDRVAVLRFPKRRNDWLLGRWTAKRALRCFLAQSGHGAPEYQALEIRSAPDGAPEAFLNGRSAPVSLALSHSGREAFCVISRPGIALGCDLEEERHPSVPLGVRQREAAGLAGSAEQGTGDGRNIGSGLKKPNLAAQGFGLHVIDVASHGQDVRVVDGELTPQSGEQETRIAGDGGWRPTDEGCLVFVDGRNERRPVDRLQPGGPLEPLALGHDGPAGLGQMKMVPIV